MVIFMEIIQRKKRGRQKTENESEEKQMGRETLKKINKAVNKWKLIDIEIKSNPGQNGVHFKPREQRIFQEIREKKILLVR